MSKCESCHIEPVELEEASDAGHSSYKICNSCRVRLINYALRPREYFNLASIHGHTSFLQSDFYNDSNGEATQPKIKIIDEYKFSFPSKENIVNSTELLIDYAFVRYFIPSDIISFLKEHKKESVLSVLKEKIKINRGVSHKAYEIAAKVLGLFAGDWIETQWANRLPGEFPMFAEAIAKCIPFPKAFSMLSEELDTLNEKDLAANISVFIYFENKKVLDWIEEHKSNISHVSSSFGIVAAINQFDWLTAEKWLKCGRPLSLIALDALLYCTKTNFESNVPLVFKDKEPKLINSPSSAVIAATLQDFLKSDDKPRTRNIINTIISNLFG